MKFKNLNSYGVLAAALAAAIFIFIMVKRRMRWGFLFLSLLIAFTEKWAKKRELHRIHSLLDRIE